MPIDGRKQYTKAREKAKKHLKVCLLSFIIESFWSFFAQEFEKQEVPQPVDLREEEISDKFEGIIR